MVRHGLLLSLTVALWWSSSAAAAELSASVDRTQVSRDGYILLTLKLINSDTRLRARGVSPNVDLTLLSDDFEVGVPHTQNRFNLYRGHGRSTSALEVELFPKRVGTAIIPPFSVDGLTSKPISVVVVPASPNPTPDIFVKSGVTKETVWLRQQTVAYLDLYYRVDLKDAQLGEHIDTDPLDIDLDKLPQGDRKLSVGPFTYHVERIGWALMPLHSGKLVVTLPELWAESVDGKKFHSPPQTKVITVKPLPASVPPLTLVGKPTLTQDLDQHEAVANKLLSWTVTLKAPTALDSLPRTLPLAKLPEQFKFYFDRPELRKDVRDTGMTAIATYAVSAIPLQAGRFAIPAIDIPYFDPDTGRMSRVTQPSVTLTVRAGAAPGGHGVAPPGPPPAAAAATGRHPRAVYYWQAATALFAALWLLTWAYRWRRPPLATTAPRRHGAPRIAHPQQHPLKALLLEAFGSRTLEEGLNDYERRHGRDPAVRDAVRAVQRLCYSPEKGTQRHSLETAVKQVARTIRNTKARAADQRPDDPWSPRTFTPAWRMMGSSSNR